MKANKASIEARRKKSDIRRTLEDILSCKPPEKIRAGLKKAGWDKVRNVEHAIMLRAATDAMIGNTDARKDVIKIMGAYAADRLADKAHADGFLEAMGVGARVKWEDPEAEEDGE